MATALFLNLLALSCCCGTAAAVERVVISNGGYLVANSSPSLASRPDDLFIPASTLKLFTCLGALQILGPDYRFQTKLYLDQSNNLYIKGFGDPLLTSETVRQIAKLVSRRGVHHIQHLFLDDTAFNLQPVAWHDETDNPYNAPNSAIAVNFNSVPFQRQANGALDSGESETPLLPIMQQLSRLHPAPGSYRLNVSVIKKQNHGLRPHLRYAGELFIAMLNEQAITVSGTIKEKKVPVFLPEFLNFYNKKTVTDAVQQCLKYSNNFIANQLFLLCGMQKSGLPATWAKGQVALEIFADQQLHLSRNQIHFIEGSGLSQTNRISARALCTILNNFLPVANLLSFHKGILLKSGTLENVFNYAGYLPVNNTLVPFAILLNQPRNMRDELLHQFIIALHASPISQ